MPHNNKNFVLSKGKTRLSTSATPASSTSSASTTTTPSQRLFAEELNVLYDSKCNVCKLEMEWLASRDVRVNGDTGPKIKLTDLESPNFDPKDPANGGIDYQTGMAAIYAITADGKILKGVPAFALAYEQVGLGWLWGIYNIPVAKQVCNFGYDIFAKYRTRLTRGSSLEELVQLHMEKKKLVDCEACENLQQNNSNLK
jgi:predicted DCC family thiol-disulfide oxidoreductase YuxK